MTSLHKASIVIHSNTAGKQQHCDNPLITKNLLISEKLFVWESVSLTFQNYAFYTIAEYGMRFIPLQNEMSTQLGYHGN